MFSPLLGPKAKNRVQDANDGDKIMAVDPGEIIGTTVYSRTLTVAPLLGHL